MKEKILKIEQFIKTIPLNIKNFCSYLLVESKNLKEKFKDLTLTNYNLGLHHINKGNIKDAKIRFLMVTKLRPDLADAHYHLARCYINELKFEKAREELELAVKLDEKLKIKANYRLALINQHLVNLAIPPEVVKEDYNMIFKEYENFMLEQNKYEAPYILANRLKEYLKDGLDVLDLGSGTGLVGEALATLNPKMNFFGIDISENMSQEAKNLFIDEDALYKNIEISDLNLFKNDKEFDLVVSSLCLGYISDLKSFINIIANNIRLEGIFACIVLEAESKNQDIEFNYNYASFGFNEEYIKSCFDTKKWTLLESVKINIFNKKTPGILLMFKKNNNKAKIKA